MRRWAWRIFVTASWLLLLASAGFWARARGARDHASIDAGVGPGPRAAHEMLELFACRDALAIQWVTLTVDLSDPATESRYRAEARDAGRFAFGTAPPSAADAVCWNTGFEHASSRWWGFGRATARMLRPTDTMPLLTAAGQAYQAHQVTASAAFVPWWFLTLLFALALIRAVYAFRKKRRRPPHCCRGCGYDLRATADPAGPRLATCPECGRATPAATNV